MKVFLGVRYSTSFLAVSADCLAGRSCSFVQKQGRGVPERCSYFLLMRGRIAERFALHANRDVE